MVSILKRARRFQQNIQSRREKRVEQGGEGSCSPATTDQNQISTSPPVPASTIPAKLPSEQAGPSDPQLLSHLSTTSVSIQPVDQLTASATLATSKSPDLWKLAYEKFRNEEPDLVDDYGKHVSGDTADSADLSSRQSVETVLKKLLEDREKKQLKISFLSRNIKIRTQVERFTKFLQWSDPLVKGALSTQPYAALAWSGVSLLLPASSQNSYQATKLLLTLIAPNKQHYAE